MIALLALAVPLALAAPSTEWRLDMVVATRAELPVLGATRAAAQSTLAVRFEPGPTGWVQVQRVCTTEVLDRGHIVRTVLPPAFVRSLPEVRFAVAELPTTLGGAYSADFGRQDVGWSGVGTLPVGAESANVTDWDSDGRPGATVLIEAPIIGTGEVYVAQTGRTLARGALGSDGVIRGSLEVVDFAQQVLGGSSAMFSRGPTVTADPSRSTFTLTPSPGFRCGESERTSQR